MIDLGQAQWKPVSEMASVIKMSVGLGEDDYSDIDANELSDNEVSFGNGGEKANEMDEDQSLNQSLGDAETTDIDEAEKEKAERKEKIRQLDREMKEKLLKLKKLMTTGGGFKESAAIADEILSGKQRGNQGNQVTNDSNNRSASQNKNSSNAKVFKHRKQIAQNIALPHKENSKETIYHNAVKSVQLNGRNSSSSEDGCDGVHDSSDEMIEINEMLRNIAGPLGVDKIGELTSLEQEIDNAEPGSLKQTAERKLTAEEKVEKLIQEAEKSKGKIFTSTGKQFNINYARDMIHSVLVDKEYSAVGSHLDEAIINKIKRGEYVDFSKLLPQDWLAIEEDNRLQPVFRDGQVFW